MYLFTEKVELLKNSSCCCSFCYDEFLAFSYSLLDTVKLGFKDHGYNEFTAITNKYNSTFLVPNGTFTTLTFTVITISWL